ncbi:MAG: hypothetical protein GY854_08985 [Deltaproteobacteria bacterium]|nr:hypothetical protein [Deltaproteobacteria bacterium]
MVPEFIENNKLVMSERWFPVFEKLAADDKALLIKQSDQAYVIVLKRSVQTQGPRP